MPTVLRAIMQDEGVRLVLDEVEHHNSTMLATIKCAAVWRQQIHCVWHHTPH